MNARPQRQVPLSRQLLLRVVGFSLLVTLAASLLNAWLSWNTEQQRQQDQLQAALVAYSPGLARAVSQRDDESLRLQMSGLTHFPAVLTAELVGPQLHHRYAKLGANLDQPGEATSHPLLAADGHQVAAFLLLRLDRELLTRQVWRDVAAFVAATAAELLLLSALLYGIVLRTVSQPLTELSRHVSGLTAGRFDRLDVPVPRPGRGPPHEVHALAEGIARLQAALRDQLAHRDANAQALQQRRDQLNALIARQTRQLDEVLLHMADGAGVVDALGTITVANPAWGRIMGLAEGEALEGWPATRWLARPGWNHLLALLQGREAQAVTTIGVRRADGREVPVEASFSVVERGAEGRPQRIQLVLRDVSVRLETERNLIAAREAALAATRAKSEFLANMSHEIRTPMNAILGMLHLSLRTALSPQQRDYLHKIHAAARSLLALINDILDFSKIEAGKLELAQAEFAVDDVLEQVTSLVALQAQAKGLAFLVDTAPDVPPRLVGDALRLAQVLTNLCNNAVKFTDRGEVVVATRLVRPGPARPDDTLPLDDRVTLRFAIIDSGIGMSAAQTAQLFRPFTQVDASSSRRHGGTGLGLAISRQLVQLMGGDIAVDSAPGEGSEFSFTARFAPAAADTLPDAPTALPPPPLPDAGPPATPRLVPQVLVLDSRARAAAVVCATADALGCRSAQAATLDEACARLRSAAADAPVDLLLLDAGSGDAAQAATLDAAYAAARRVRGLPLRQPPRVVVLVPAGQEALIPPAARAAFDGVLSRPVTAATLLALLCEQFAGRGFVPLRRGTRPVSAPVPLPPGNLRQLDGLRVLLAEDNPINREVAVALLAEMGVRLTCADNGLEALRRLDEQPADAPFELVLMDVQMPGMDGLEATRCIRARAEWRSLPVIAITAHAMARDREQCMAAGMNDFISKPFDPADLCATLARWAPPGRSTGTPTAVSAAATAPTAAPNAAPNAAPAALPGALPRHVPGLTLAEGLRHCDGKPALYLRMLQLFVRSRADTRDTLQQGLAEGGHAAMAKLVHMVKGEAGTLGARTLFTTAAALEAELAAMAAGHSPASTRPTALPAFEAALHEVLDGLAEALKTPAPLPG
ncbi:response regulator [Ideonella sp. DXS22W]|uniref:histidine kinase n=1 Tax=Pseudaquabacterium inlustre TaxID=2984192 RepID=A0ABU9CQG8_9BURK